MQASKNACKSQKNVVILHRVRQLKRTELAWRVESAQCLRSPQKLKIFGGPIDRRKKKELAIEAQNFITNDN